MKTYIGTLQNTDIVGLELGDNPNLKITVGNKRFFTQRKVRILEEIHHARGKRVRIDYEELVTTIPDRIIDFLIGWDARTPRRYNQINRIEIV